MSTESYERLEMVIKWAGLTTHAFAMKIGLKRSENVYRIIRRKENVSLRLSSLILETYDQINRDWFLYGEGKMIVNTNDYQNKCNTIPYYTSSCKNIFDKTPLFNFSLPFFQEADLAITVSDKAMEPLIPMGSTIILKQISSDIIIYGQTYSIETEDLSMIRVVRKREGSDNEIILEAINQKQYDKIILKKERIKHFYIVCGMLTKFI